MDAFSIVKDLLFWIEDNLENDMSIDAISHKAGYSKWHLQRMFSSVTGYKLGTYVRERRLTLSAYALRVTSTSIVDIAVLYRFESQQSFTRSFKRTFGKSPGAYRHSPEWDFNGLRPHLGMDNKFIPSHSFIIMPELNLSGITHSYSCRPSDFSSESVNRQVNYWGEHLKKHDITGEKLYGLRKFQPVKINGYEKEILYTTALVKTDGNYVEPELDSLKLEGGLFVKFNFTGTLTELLEFVVFIYKSYLPLLNISRRDDYDVEVFYLSKDGFSINDNIVCDYLIPIQGSAGGRRGR